jgi:hypothetical protein
MNTSRLHRQGKGTLVRPFRLGSPRGEMVQRARPILMLAEGCMLAEVEQNPSCDSPYLTRWERCFVESRVRGLDSR